MANNRVSVSRRDFVKGAAALGVGAPLMLPASVVRGDSVTTAPSERITLGFIGIGKQAHGHLDSLSGMKTTQVLAVCDVDTVRRDHAKDLVDKKYALLERKGQTVDAYKDFRELLDRKDIDAVVIGTPDHWHAAIAIEAAKAGKDIYCEKPLTLTIHEAKTLVDVIRKHHRVFQTGSQQRSEGPFREACEYIRNGRLGKIQEILVGLPGPTSKWCDLPAETPDPGLNWDVWLGQAPMRTYNQIICRKGLPDTYPFNPGWRDYREYSGGYVTDWGAHHFDIVQWALDMDDSGPSEVIPPEKEGDKFGAKVIYRGTRFGDDIPVTHVEVAYEFDTLEKMKQKATTQNTSPADIEVRKHIVDKNGILFVGEKGKLFVSRSRMILDSDTIDRSPMTEKDQRLFVSPGHRQNWLDCIKSREWPICDVEIGARSVTVCHLINLAYWHNRKLNWDPQRWEFPGDAEANGWRSRERREGYELPAI